MNPIRNSSSPDICFQQAVAQAVQATLVCDPNPRVGCIIVDANGRTLGQGHTQQVGQAHAEIMALRAAQAAGFDVRGATAYVTLEPCSHHGRTPPCCDALIEAGIARVAVALKDPTPLVAGQGIARMRMAGIEVAVLNADHPAASATRELNIGFFSRMIRKTPWVRMKIAASLDGKTALENGESQWITSEAARTDGHVWRARASAILTGIGTILEDNPRLDVRSVATHRQPHLVVVDSRLQLPLNANLFTGNRTIYVYAAVPDDAKKTALEERGATVIYLPGQQTGNPDKVDLAAMLRDLARREVNELHVEAGHKLNGSLLRESLIDEFLVYLAPKLLGSGHGMASFGPLQQLSNAVPLEFMSIQPVGVDLRVTARVAGRDRF